MENENKLVLNIIEQLYEEFCNLMNNPDILDKVLEYANEKNLDKNETIDKLYSKIETQLKLKIQNTSQFISH